MANPSVTYTFTNGNTSDATQINTNFTDLINGLTDGTKDLSISALTAAGSATFNGNVTLGNSTSDDVNFTGSLASTMNLKTTNSFNIGSSTIGLAGIYFGANSQTTRIVGSGSMSATYTLTLPPSGGTKGYGLETNGSGTLTYKPMQTDVSGKSADYTVLDDDGIGEVAMTTSSTDRTVTLPTASANSGRTLTIVKVDSASGKCTIEGEDAETIDGATSVVLHKQYESVTLYCNGTSWEIRSARWASGTYNPTITDVSNTHGDSSFDNAYFARLNHDTVKIFGRGYLEGTNTASNLICTINLPLVQGNFTENYQGFGMASTAGGVGAFFNSTDNAATITVTADGDGFVFGYELTYKLI